MSTIEQRIPLTEMDCADPKLLAELLEAVGSVARSGAFTGGAAVGAFETAFATFCEVPHAVGVSSGTEALALALRALGVGPGDDVVVPANSFIATAEAVSLVGARPRFADVDPVTQLVTAETLQAALTPTVRCVIPVHLYGRTVEMDPVLELASAHGLLVLEDAAQAHGARYRGRRAGTLGDAGTFSFYPAKNLGAWGDAGAVVSSSEQVAEQVRLLRSHGESPRYVHSRIGTTARLDAIQAALLTVKLARLDAANTARRRVAGWLRESISDCQTVLAPAPVGEGTDHVYHQFVVRTRWRDQLREHLASAGIANAIHYPIPINRSKAYEHLEEWHVAPAADRLSAEILSLPIFPGLDQRRAQIVGRVLAEFEPPD